MMQKVWLKKQKLSYSSEVLDVAQFGSSVMINGKPRDIDIVVLFKKMPLKEQLIEAQKIKKQLQAITDLPIHIISFDLSSFFNASNFARDNILFYGKSIVSGKRFAENFALIPKLEIFYFLDDLEKKDKVRFNYMLNGRKGEYGFLREFNGKLIKPGMIEILPETENIFVENIRKITPRFEVRKILLSTVR